MTVSRFERCHGKEILHAAYYFPCQEKESQVRLSTDFQKSFLEEKFAENPCTNKRRITIWNYTWGCPVLVRQKNRRQKLRKNESLQPKGLLLEAPVATANVRNASSPDERLLSPLF